ncbi:MAG: zinc finger MYND domain-containing protein [archaeon]|nr:zinc finger MYND domain-containing protein [archaeon]
MNKAKYLVDQLSTFESEEIISHRLEELKLEEIGSEKFIKQHSYINKLNMQVVKNILSGGEDAIMMQFIDYEKLKPLIKDLFTMNAFKNKIYPEIKKDIATHCSLKAYLCLYHEACLLNLIENFFYSITACQAAEDFIVDVIEYAYVHLTKYVNRILKEGKKEVTNDKPITMEKLSEEIKNFNEKHLNSEEENLKELEEKKEEIDFNIAMCCINILRYISDHLEQLPFPVRHHMMNVKDIPMLFVTVMETKPWERKTKNGKIEIFENNNWSIFENLNNKLPKLEAQVWITIYNLFMVQENSKKYEINQYRQSQLLRLRKYFSDKLYDQIPQMTNFYRSLEEMALMSFNNVLTVNPFVVEMIPILSNSDIFKISPEKCKEIGQKIVNKYFKITQEQLKREMEPVSEVYSLDNMEYFMDDPKCANCGKDATNRCSRCKSEWYCSKECQIKRWKSHKEMCKVLAKLAQEEEKENAEKKTKTFVEEIINKEPKKEENKKIL